MQHKYLIYSYKTNSTSLTICSDMLNLTRCQWDSNLWYLIGDGVYIYRTIITILWLKIYMIVWIWRNMKWYTCTTVLVMIQVICTCTSNYNMVTFTADIYKIRLYILVISYISYRPINKSLQDDWIGHGF